jgi:hypothetical protein
MMLRSWELLALDLALFHSVSQRFVRLYFRLQAVG